MYYLFFSATVNGRENDYLYESYAAKAEYERIVKEVKNYSSDTLTAKVKEYGNTFSADTPTSEYTAEEWAVAKKALDDYAVAVEANPEETVNLARDCVLNVETVKIHKTAPVDHVYSIGIAVSDSPVGPFHLYTNVEGEEFMPGAEYNADARTIDGKTPFLAHEDFYTALAQLKVTDSEKAEALASVLPARMTMIDANPFVDPKTNDKYLYFSSCQPSQEYIFGIKLGKKWTDDPQWETLTPVSRYGYVTVDGQEQIDYPQSVNKIEEGPHMYYDAETQKYYLTFSVNGAYDKEYAVGQAIGDSPLGTFTKVPMANGGLVIAADLLWDHVSGPGHHCFIQYDGKMYILYQGLYERFAPVTQTRGICVDEVKSFINDNGVKVFNANGPSYALMPKIGPDAQYKNIAGDALITVSGGEKKEALNDGLLNIMTHHDLVPEFSAAAGTTTITIDFTDYRAIRAIMVYNARDLENWFDKIDRIELDFTLTKDGKEVKDTAYMSNLVFNKDLYTFDLWDTSRPGGSVCAEFDEIQVKTIRITIKSDKAFSISEIFVLGK